MDIYRHQIIKRIQMHSSYHKGDFVHGSRNKWRLMPIYITSTSMTAWSIGNRKFKTSSFLYYLFSYTSTKDQAFFCLKFYLFKCVNYEAHITPYIFQMTFAYLSSSSLICLSYICIIEKNPFHDWFYLWYLPPKFAVGIKYNHFCEVLTTMFSI